MSSFEICKHKKSATQFSVSSLLLQTLFNIFDLHFLLQARMPGGADLFICYGGIQLRESVAAKADWLVFNFKDLINSLV